MTSTSKINAFFKAIGNAKPLIATSKTKNGMKMQRLNAAIDLNLYEDHDVYFVANPSKGFKKEDVTYLSTNFVDLDCGRAKNGEYKSVKDVSAFKKKAMARIAKLDCPKPTAIVETRNGYHVYYSYKPIKADAHNRSLWEKKQNFLFNFFKDFGCDPKVLKPNQLLRVPYTLWHKKWSGNHNSCETKLVKIDKNIDFNKLPVSDTKDGIEKSEYSYKKYADVKTRPLLLPPDASTDSGYSKAKTNATKDLSELAALLGDIVSILYAKNCKFLANAAKEWQQKLIYG